MKEPEQTKDCSWDFNPSWGSFLNPSARLCLSSLDFSDLWDEEDSTEDEGSHPTQNLSTCLQTPPAPPLPLLPPPPPPPPLVPLFPSSSAKGATIKSRTLKLHWRELQNLGPLPRMTRFGAQTIWAALEPVHVDTNRLQYLFESKGSSTSFNVVSTRQKQLTVSVLGMKRSNIVTIALSSLPPPRLLPPAILSMDSSVLDREDVQRLQALIPTEEEICLIKEAKAQNPQSSLAPAELCLLTLGDVPLLSHRLQLWAFALDYDSLEREVAEPLFHLKLAMEQLAASQTFRRILATVLEIGNFLNGCKARGFELSYLGKLSQVRDTHTRQPLLHHVCVLLLKLYPQSSDLYSDITAVTKAGKCDYSEVQSSFIRLEALCNSSWEQLKVLEKVDDKRKGGNGERKRGGGGDEVRIQEGLLRPRLPKILKECEERMKVLKAVHRRVINRFHSFLLFLGYSKAMARDTRAEDFCKTISNFSLEYRAARQNVLLQRERERQRSGAGSPAPSTTVEWRKSQQSSSQQVRAVQATNTRPSQSQETGLSVLAALCASTLLVQQEGDEQTRLEEVLRTPDSISRLDVTLPRNRKRTTELQGSLSRKLKW